MINARPRANNYLLHGYVHTCVFFFSRACISFLPALSALQFACIIFRNLYILIFTVYLHLQKDVKKWRERGQMCKTAVRQYKTTRYVNSFGVFVPTFAYTPFLSDLLSAFATVDSFHFSESADACAVFENRRNFKVFVDFPKFWEQLIHPMVYLNVSISYSHLLNINKKIADWKISRSRGKSFGIDYHAKTKFH